jgi:hypothetical protein
MIRKVVSLLLIATGIGLGADEIERLEVFPETVTLASKRSQVQLVVTGWHSNGELRDLTRNVEITTEDDGVATVSNGIAFPVQNGETRLIVRSGAQTVYVPTVVTRQTESDPIRFNTEIQAALTMQGCNAGSCHGSPDGKAGFSLSLFGFDSRHDLSSLVRDGGNRRVNVLDPDESLMLKKPLLRIPHVGGKKLNPADTAYQVLRQWIFEGAKPDPPESAQCTEIEVYPSPQRILSAPHLEQQIRVIAQFDDGTSRDITHLATYGTSHENVATITPLGLVVGRERGQTAITVRYLQYLESVYFTVVQPVPGFEWEGQPENNYVDQLVNAKLRQLKHLPAETCPDSTFVRRVYLDLTGLLPTAEQVVHFLNDPSPQKRDQLIDRLLETDSHARFWALKTADLMRVNTALLPDGRAELLFNWIRDNYRDNLAHDRFAHQILTASGDSKKAAPANYFCTTKSAEDLTEMTSQIFMGSRIGCAKCHNHPFENWTQNDYYSISAVFARVQQQGPMVQLTDAGETTHPATGQVMVPWGNASTPDVDNISDRRIGFANWLIADENPFFARVEVNRIWSHLFGRGIVDPVDDFRSSNPPSNVELLDALASDLVRHGFDRRHIIATICRSQTYQRDTATNPFNANDSQLCSHIPVRLLSAEQLQDAIGYVTATLPDASAMQREADELRRQFDKEIGKFQQSQEAWEKAFIEQAANAQLDQTPWYSIGPFQQGGYEETRKQEFVPAMPKTDTALQHHDRSWLIQPSWNDDEQIDFSGGNTAYYVHRTLQATQTMDVTLHLKGDDGVTIWIDGKQVFDRPTSFLDGQIPLHLHKGSNDLLMKITNGGGAFYFHYNIPNKRGSQNVLTIVGKPAKDRTVEERQLIRDVRIADRSDLVDLQTRIAKLMNRHEFATQRPYPEQTDFLKAFGQPKRESPCACERASEPTLDQALQLLNGQEVHRRVERSVAKFANLESVEFIDQLYLAAFSRHPRDEEHATAKAYLNKSENREEAVKDVVWAILNTQEFMFQH